MNVINCKAIRQDFQKRLATIVKDVNRISSIVNILPVTAMRDIIEYKYKNIVVELCEIPQKQLEENPTANMYIERRAHKSSFYISDWMCARFANVVVQLELTKGERERLIDNFLLHELFHRNQGFFDGRHRTVRDRDPRALLEIDYQADVLAVQVQFAIEASTHRYPLKSLTMGQKGYRLMLLRIIQSSIHQTHMFCTVPITKHPLSDDATPAFSEFRTRDEHLEWAMTGDGYPPVQFFRNAAWHIQWHMCRLFNQHSTLVDFRLNERPYLSAKGAMQRVVRPNVSAIPDNIKALWKDTEAMLVAINHFGMRERSDDFAFPSEFQNFFNGIFTANPYDDGTGKYLTELLCKHPHFIGYLPDDNPIDKPPPEGPSPGMRKVIVSQDDADGRGLAADGKGLDSEPPNTVQDTPLDTYSGFDENKVRINYDSNVTFDSVPIIYDLYNDNHKELLRCKLESLFIASSNPIPVEEQATKQVALALNSERFGALSAGRKAVEISLPPKAIEVQHSSAIGHVVSDDKNLKKYSRGEGES